jgi:signal transduction histidine kinase
MNTVSTPAPPPPASSSASSSSAWPRAWVGWRWRLLILLALLGCCAVLAVFHATVRLSQVQATFLSGQSAPGPGLWLQAAPPQRLTALQTDAQAMPVDSALFATNARWTARATARNQQQAQQAAVDRAIARLPTATATTNWRTDTGSLIELPTAARGIKGLPWSFWPLMGLALLLYLAAVVVVLARPSERNAAYAAMCVAQSVNVGLIAVTTLPPVGESLVSPLLAYQLRGAMDVFTAAALVHASAVHPQAHPAAAQRVALAWTMAVLVTASLWVQPGAWDSWWLLQLATMGGGLWATWQWRRTAAGTEHPMGTLMYRFALCGSIIYGITTALAMVSSDVHHPARQAAEVGSTVWVVFFGLMLAMLPSLSRTHHLMREFALIAAVSTLATAVDLLFVATLSISNFTSLALALFLALGLYAAFRQWLLGKVLARERFTAERTFETVFRIAREVQQRPQELTPQFSRLMRQLFDPLTQTAVDKTPTASVVLDEGSALLVPWPRLAGEQAAPGALKLTFAGRGKRLFVTDDARLADRVREQLMRAVAFDQAVEHGRAEERARIAQDLHDDIGARLLTLMYKAPDAETEDYVRHTLKDLKTLTRGLATASHCLSYACAEWKTDVSQRLMTADCELGWTFIWDVDVPLTVVQWSALTRVLRELVSNTIAHAHATKVDIEGVLERGTLRMVVADNGVGRAPEQWSHGLGLGGVRKRVHQLGGQAQWREREGGGIVCEVIVPRLGGPAVPGGTLP